MIFLNLYCWERLKQKHDLQNLHNDSWSQDVMALRIYLIQCLQIWCQQYGYYDWMLTTILKKVPFIYKCVILHKKSTHTNTLHPKKINHGLSTSFLIRKNDYCIFNYYDKYTYGSLLEIIDFLFRNYYNKCFHSCLYILCISFYKQWFHLFINLHQDANKIFLILLCP